MQAAELETDLDPELIGGHARRALALIAFSIAAILLAGTVYLRPTLSFGGGQAAPVAPRLHADYRVASVNFVSPTLGWLVIEFPSADYAVIRTTDAGATWTRQLTEPSDSYAVYARFFDDLSGLVALVGGRPVLNRTVDGGATWSAIPALTPNASVLSWSFVDSMYGWMLAREDAAAAPKLFRTVDGGTTWIDLGFPVSPPDQAFQIQFSHFTTGWLSTVGAGPYAYRTQDFGVSWTRTWLPVGGQAQPAGGEYFVAVKPTTGLGALATVVYFPPVNGRTGVGGIVRDYPPLTVRAFDGGRPHTYLFTTVLDQVVTGPFANEPPPNQAELRTVDAGRTWSAMTTPEDTGAIGYVDESHWWWIGDGAFAGSSDGGATWTDLRDIGVVDPLPGSLELLDRDHAWFAGQTGSRPRLEMTDDGGRHWTLMGLPPLEDGA